MPAPAVPALRLMLSPTVDEDPLSLQSVTRTFVADAITPISAYLALAQPGRSCLLESVEGSDRMSRYSFIGIDYLETAGFDDDPAMLPKLRALIGKYRLDTSGLPFPGGAVCVFTYDAARVLERIGPKPPGRSVRRRAGGRARHLMSRPLHPAVDAARLCTKRCRRAAVTERLAD